jgi:hypothetical protein
MADPTQTSAGCDCLVRQQRRVPAAVHSPDCRRPACRRKSSFTQHVRCQRGYPREGAVHTVILRVVPGRWASSKASDDLGVEGDADRDRRLQTPGGLFWQRREIREANHRDAGLLETNSDPALQGWEILC